MRFNNRQENSSFSEHGSTVLSLYAHKNHYYTFILNNIQTVITVYITPDKSKVYHSHIAPPDGI